MGWDYHHADKPIDRKSECRSLLSDRYEIVRDALVGTTWYAAARNRLTGEVQAIVVLTAIDRGSWWNFGVKWMGEDDGPGQTACPKAILDLLTPTTNRLALQWREECLATIKANGRQKTGKEILRTAPYGSRLIVTLTDGTTRTVVKMEPGYSFKSYWLLVEHQGKYVPKRFVKSAVYA